MSLPSGRPTWGREVSLPQEQAMYPLLSLSQFGYTAGPSLSSQTNLRIPPPTPIYNFALEKRLLEQLQEKRKEEEAEEKALAARLHLREESIEEALAKLKVAEEEKQAALEKKRKEAETIKEVQALAVRLEKEEEAKRNRKNSMAIKEALTETQKQLLKEFNELSGSATTEEEDVLYLTLCGWDLNRAVGIWWDSDCVMQQAMMEASKKPGEASAASSGEGEPSPQAAPRYLVLIFPDGSQNTAQFDQGATLWTLYQFVAARAHTWNNRAFAMERQAAWGQPSKIFEEHEFNLTLDMAGLFDSATIKITLR